MDAAIRALRVTATNRAPLRPRGAYVLYWMIAARRTTWSFALDHAVARAEELGRPLLVLEALRCGHRWASDRFHAFVMRGIADNTRACAAAGVTYLSYVEPEPGHGSGLLAALARRACVVVTDEQPGFFLPDMVGGAAARLDVLLEQVDGNGLFPLRALPHAFVTARKFRRVLQEMAPLSARPSPRPLARLTSRDADIAGAILRRWGKPAPALAALPIDHAVAPVERAGGPAAAAAQLARFVDRGLPRYADESRDPDAEATSGLSPYLHFGHISAHAVAARVGRVAGEYPDSSERFLDQLVTWRELAYNLCFHRADYDRYSAVPAWARATLAEHARDPRPERYSARELAEARTGDPVWNAVQRQLRFEGRAHNYLRMLWGKKILEWSATPQRALATMIDLNNRYALDGRDPNSYGGILWIFGLYDRPWGPERSIFGTVRYMSSQRTAEKLEMRAFLSRWAAP